MQLGEIIKAYREKAGLSQSDLAKQCHISQGTMSRMEANLQNPSAVTLRRIAKALDLTIDEMLQSVDSEELVEMGEDKIARTTSSFMYELSSLEDQLTPQQRSILLKIARALAYETTHKPFS